jgi:hypothetical protein
MLQRMAARHNMRFVRVKEDSASRLCKSCGICCRGLLHSHALLKEGESDAASALGLDVQSDGRSFSLPCRRFENCCTVYAERPSPCRGFRCALLRRLDDGDVSLQEALDVVVEAHRLAKDAFPSGSPAEQARQFRMQRSLKEQDIVGATPEKLKFIALGLYLDRHFVLSRDGHFYAMDTIADEGS